MGLNFRNCYAPIKILKVRNYIGSKLFLFNENPKNNKYFKSVIVYKNINVIHILHYICNQKLKER
jgi:hypothetical protein